MRARGAFRVENKDSYSNQFIMKLGVLDKIRSECAFKEKPVLVVTFMEKITFRPRQRWACIPFEDWEEYANAPGNNR